MNALATWATWVALALVAFLVGLAAAMAYGRHRWNAGTRRLHDALSAGSTVLVPERVDFAALASLPMPVQRYLRRVLVDGAPMVTGVRMRQRGSMRMSEAARAWKPFTSEQTVVTLRAGFCWSARIAMLPGMTVLVRDAYVAGRGTLRAALLGLITVAELGGTEDMAQAELMRFLAEAVWYPTVLLLGQGISWSAIDAQHARATITDGATRVSLVFSFDDDGLVDGIRADARGRTVGGITIPTPWSGRFWNYQQVSSMLLPFNGEVGWVLPEGLQPYWRGEIESVVMTFEACRVARQMQAAQ